MKAKVIQLEDTEAVRRARLQKTYEEEAHREMRKIMRALRDGSEPPANPSPRALEILQAMVDYCEKWGIGKLRPVKGVREV
jgi:predicted RNA-binding protein associated with RNAse of E/G family